MKKILFFTVIISLVAAGCSTSSFVKDTNRLNYAKVTRDYSQVNLVTKKSEKMPTAFMLKKVSAKLPKAISVNLVGNIATTADVRPLNLLNKKNSSIRVKREKQQTPPTRKLLKKADKVLTKIAGESIIKKQNNTEETKSGGGKSQLIALLLVIFLGVFGIHRFYLGYIGIGIIQLLTAGGFGIWALIDLIRIITGDLKPKNGNYT